VIVIIMVPTAIVVAIMVAIVVAIVAMVMVIPFLVPPVIVASPFIIRLIFGGSDEIHGTPTGVVFAAVVAPVTRVFGWNMQIYRRRRDLRHGLDHQRLGIHHRGRRRIVHDLNLSIDSWDNPPRDDDIDAEFAGIAETCAADCDHASEG